MFCSSVLVIRWCGYLWWVGYGVCVMSVIMLNNVVVFVKCVSRNRFGLV